MNYTNVIGSIETILEDGFNTVPIKFENVDLIDIRGEHVSLSDQDVESRLACMNTNSRIVKGIVSVNIMTKSGTGTDKAKKIAMEICNILSHEPVDGILFTGQAELVSVGDDDLDGLYKHVLYIPYLYENSGQN